MAFNVAAATAIFISLYLFLWALLRFTHDEREPPSVEDNVPFLGPLIGMARQGSKFHKNVHDKTNLPIYTLRLPGSRIYIINDTSLIPVLQRQVRTLSLAPILVRFFSHFMGITGKGLEIMSDNALEHGGFVHKMTVAADIGLSPGPNLDDLNAKAVGNLNKSLGTLCAENAPTTVGLFAWASEVIMMATTDAIYGSRNPFKDPAVHEAYYKYEGGLVPLIIGFMPSVFARASVQARDVITKAFVKYYNEGGLDEDSPAYARYRYEYPSKLGMPLVDIAKMEAGGSLGLVSNTMPATFWTLYHLLSDPVALADCRRELAGAVHEKNGEIHLDLAHIKSSCPILTSTMQEAFRFHSVGTTARAVVEDHMLGGKYLLRKGSTVLTPSTVQHSSTAAWGPNVSEFDYKRFVKEPNKSKRRHNPVAFRAFGGGSTLCPGRQFASTEILAFASIILLRFDITPASGGGWDTAGYKTTHVGFRLPGEDVRVQLTPRDNKQWHVFFSETGKALEISSEDIDAAKIIHLKIQQFISAMRQVESASASGVTTADSPAVLNVSDHAFPDIDGNWTGFPKQTGQSLSYWLQGVRCDPLLDHRSTSELPASADIVVIGSGITGTLVAKKCLETWPEQSVVVLEAREFCSGATGRNAGHCKPDQWRGFGKYEKAFGAKEALQILQNEQETWENLVQYVHDNKVDCDLWVGDTLDVAMTPEVATLAKDVFERYKAAGGKVDHITVTVDPAEASKVSRLKGAQACFAWPASTLQPWKLVAHIMRSNIAQEPRFNLQTYTTVRKVTESRDPGKWTVHSDRGDIECSRVVHATNAYGAAVEPSLRGLVVPTPHMCNKVVPPASFAGSRALRNSYGVLLPDGALFSVNTRPTSDGVIMFGGSNPGQRKFREWLKKHPERWTDDGLSEFPEITAAVKSLAEEQLDGWAAAVPGPGTLYDYSWSGIIGYTTDGVPFIGELPGLPGQWICAGHNGHGMARTFTAAPGLVKLMNGESWEQVGLPDPYQLTAERLERLRNLSKEEVVVI